MKILLYTRRNTGVIALSLLVALGHNVSVITDDDNVRRLAKELNCPEIKLEDDWISDLLLSVHGNRIIPEEKLSKQISINVHPVLFKYKGHNPIKRYIDNKDKMGSVAAHYMVAEVDAGKVICEQFFMTGVVKTYAEFYNTALPYYVSVIIETLKIVKE